MGSWNLNAPFVLFGPFCTPKTLRFNGEMSNFDAKKHYKIAENTKGQMVPFSRMFTPPPSSVYRPLRWVNRNDFSSATSFTIHFEYLPKSREGTRHINIDFCSRESHINIDVCSGEGLTDCWPWFKLPLRRVYDLIKFICSKLCASLYCLKMGALSAIYLGLLSDWMNEFSCVLSSSLGDGLHIQLPDSDPHPHPQVMIAYLTAKIGPPTSPPPPKHTLSRFSTFSSGRSDY